MKLLIVKISINVVFSATLYIDGVVDFKDTFTAIKDIDDYAVKVGYGVKYYPAKSDYTGSMKSVVYYSAALPKDTVRSVIKQERPDGVKTFDAGGSVLHDI